MLTAIARQARRAGRAMQAGFDHGRAGLHGPWAVRLAMRYVWSLGTRRLRGVLRARALRGSAAIPSGPDRDGLLSMLSSRMGVLLLHEDDRCAALGIRDIDFPAALSALRAACPEARLLCDGTEVDPGGSGWLRLLTAPRVELVQPGGQRIALECYETRPNGVWLSRNRANATARALYQDPFSHPGLTRLADILPAPTLSQRLRDEPVDLVYTWVNHQDPAWIEAFARHAPRPAAGAGDESDAAALSRFHSSDELRYSLRSVALNLPWARRIHVVTNCAPPDWLDPDHPCIRWIPHERIIPPEYLPTFSSHVIESRLHHIPDLSPRFLYLNDDVFVVTPKEKAFFFGASGNSRAFLEEDGVVSGPVRASDPDHLNAARNSARLLARDFGVWPTQLHKHAPFALRQDILAEIEARWAADFARFRPSRFRSPQDLNLTSFLYHHYALATGRAEIAPLRLSLVMPMDLRWKNRLRTALEGDVEALCLNEGGAHAPGADWHRSIRRFLEDNFPEPAPWERPGIG